MTTITPFAAGSYLTNRTASNLSTLKNQLNDLSNQISSGLASQTYGGLGSGRSAALGAQATLSALAGYASGITAAQTRTNLAVTSLTQVVTMGTSAGATLNNGLQSVAASSVAGRATALGDLQTAFDALNQSAAGNYLFGGSDATTQPVADTNAILNGVTNSDGSMKAGLTQMIAEQVGADGGPGKDGWLTVSQTAPTQISIAEPGNDAVRANFGFILAGKPSSTTSAIQSTYTAGTATSAGSLQVNVNAQPAVGDSITLTLKMHDGTTTSFTLTAAASGSSPASSATSFALGTNGDTAATASNLNAALTSAIAAAASGPLAVSSTATASSHFFTGSVKGGPAGTGVMPDRVQFDGSGTPIGYRSATPQDTVLWYQGENTYSAPTTQTPAINTQSVQVSGSSSIGTGARAIDPAVQNVLAGLATMAFGLPTTSNATTRATYQAVIDTAGGRLASANGSGGVQDTVTQLSIASARLSNASTTNKATQSTVQNTLDGIEQAPTEEVVAKLLDLQNRLQASYQITSTLSKLSLVNYIS